MFEVGDIVMIKAKHKEHAMPGSPVLNLEGTIAEIISKDVRNTYSIKFIELVTEDRHKFDESQARLLWRDEHFVLVEHKSPILELDTSILFEE